MSIFVHEVGPRSAPAVVLLHGAGTSGWMWKMQVPALASDLHVLVPDLPGHGKSNRRRWISIADTADLVADLVDSRTSTGKAHIVGLSLGGYVGVCLAARNPGVAASAIVSGVNVLPFPNPGRMRLMSALMAPIVKWGPVVRASARSLNVPQEDFAGYRDGLRAMTRQAFRKVNQEVLDFRLPAEANSSSCPILAVAGETEDALIKRSLAKIAESFPVGEARIAPGVGHGWNVEEPELFSAMIRSQVNGEAPPPQLLRIDAS